MRRLVIYTLLLFFFLTFSYNVLAKSGCCSGHNGVNCSAGGQGNGHVICNDGWTNSSCLYSEMVMCGGSSGSTTNSQPVYIPPTEIVYPTNTPRSLPTWTPKPSRTPAPEPTETSIPILIPTNKPTPLIKRSTKKLTVKKTVQKKNFWQWLFGK